MKNKKLFAILTLVCFMFTLMPVAAFAASPAVGVLDEEGDFKQTINVTEGTDAADVTFAMDDEDEEVGTYAYIIVENDELYAYTTESSYEFEEVGTFYVYAVDYAEVDDFIDADNMKKDAKWDLIQEKDSFVDDALTVKVKADSDIEYSIVLAGADDADLQVYELDADGDIALDDEGNPIPVEGKYAITIDANNGWDDEQGEVVATLYRGSEEVKGAELTFTKAGYVDIAYADGTTTDRGGEVEFEVTSDRTGEYKVIVKYGTKAKAELAVSVVAEMVAGVAVETAPKAPVDMDQNIADHEVEFKFTDATGRAYSNDAVIFDTDYVKVLLTDKPADSTLEKDAFTLAATADDGVYALTGEDFDEEGEYTIKVVLKNGKSAEVTVKAAEMGEIVGIKYDVYNTPRTVAYGETTNVDAVLAYDAAGVTRNVAALADFSANGVAVANLTENTRTPGEEKYALLTAKDDDDYIGETITVFAQYEGFVASTVLTVVDQAATISFADATAEVGVNTEIKGSVVDTTGKMSSIAGYIGGLSGNGMILEKPADAVAVATWDVDSKGNVVLDFLASEAGTYKVQVAISYDANPRGDAEMRFVSGVATINVGGAAGQFNDVVVVSIGADSMIVNSEVVKLDVAPYITNGRTMLQYNVLGAFGFDVQWVGETQSVVAEGNGIKVVMTIGSKVAVVNGAEVALDVAPQIVNGRTIVPVGFLTGNFGITPNFTYNADGTIADIIFTAAK